MFFLLLTCVLLSDPGNLKARSSGSQTGTLSRSWSTKRVESDSAPSTLLRGGRTSLNGADRRWRISSLAKRSGSRPTERPLRESDWGCLRRW